MGPATRVRPPARCALALIALLGLVAPSGCGGGAEPAATTNAAVTSAEGAASSGALVASGAGTVSSPHSGGAGASTTASASSHPPVRSSALPDAAFFEWIAGHCYVDELGPSAYTTEWLRYEAKRTDLEPDSLWPVPDGAQTLVAGSAEAQRLAAELRRTWLANPTSHVVDCSFWVMPRTCPRCKRGDLVGRYVAYLPAALFVAPERVGAILELVPGGRGGRTRAFLSPIPNKTIWNIGSGGLRTKQRVDAYLAAHPDSVPPIVVAPESRGAELNNGQTEYLVRDLPQHIADTFLGGRAAGSLTLGAQGISSGGRAVMEALFDEPAAFQVGAFTCMACGKLDPRRPFGLVAADFERWADALAERARSGALELRFTMGSRDGQKPCSEVLYRLFGAHGLFDLSAPPRYTNCVAGKPESEDTCDAERPGWISFAGEMHHYGLLKKSYPPELEWLLGALDRVRRRAQASATAP